MRVGDFGLELVGRDAELREIESGHVLARPGSVYSIRLRNHGPLRCVVDVELDGKVVSRDGLVVPAYGMLTLERPVDDNEHGRFTVIAEGDERVFGPDGGRDNADLGLVSATFRRELPAPKAEPLREWTGAPMPSPAPSPARPMSVPGEPRPNIQNRSTLFERTDAEVQMSRAQMRPSAASRVVESLGDVLDNRRAAGTGLTGHSSQEFVPIKVGALETESTTLQLRVVVGTEEELAAPRPLRSTTSAPARPAARP